MKQREYIKNWLDNNREALGITSALYEYHKYSETHFLKLKPENIIDTDAYQTTLSELVIAFEDMFSNEMLCFIGESSLTRLENPEYLYFRTIAFVPTQITKITVRRLMNYLNKVRPSIRNNFVSIQAASINMNYPSYKSNPIGSAEQLISVNNLSIDLENSVIKMEPAGDYQKLAA